MITRFCKICFSPLKINTLHTLLDKSICICQKCFDAMSANIHKMKINNISGIYLFEYNDVIKEKIYTFKGCGDIELSSIFLNYFKNELRLIYKKYFIVCAPSNDEDDKKREFNHVKEIAQQLKLPIIDALFKTKKFKQSDLKKKDREKVVNNLSIKNKEMIKDKKILFIDDISTSGSTLKACLNLLKSANPKKLSFLIIAKVSDKADY